MRDTPMVTVIKDDTFYPPTYRAICSHTGAVGKGSSPSAATEDLGGEIRRQAAPALQVASLDPRLPLAQTP